MLLLQIVERELMAVGGQGRERHAERAEHVEAQLIGQHRHVEHVAPHPPLLAEVLDLRLALDAATAGVGSRACARGRPRPLGNCEGGGERVQPGPRARSRPRASAQGVARVRGCRRIEPMLSRSARLRTGPRRATTASRASPITATPCSSQSRAKPEPVEQRDGGGSGRGRLLAGAAQHLAGGDRANPRGPDRSGAVRRATP